MKKIGVLTFHRADSYGAFLQAYATVAFLNEYGYKAELIDYTNSYEQRFRKLFYTESGKLSGYVTSFIKDFVFKKRYYKKKAFGNMESYCPLSKERYLDTKQLDHAIYDILVVGSDQVWNRNITNGLDDAFLLRHGTAKQRISIASSMGSIKLSLEDQAVFKNALKSFTAISVREDFAKNQLSALTNIPIKVLLDPTFLFKKKEWINKLAKKSRYNKTADEKYILTFFLAADDTYKKRVKGLSNILNLPVWSIQSIKINRVDSDRIILGATVADFVSLIANAELIITDSFHGAALSINLEKNFVAFKNKENPVRVMTLLDTLNLSERLDLKVDQYHIVNYYKVKKILEPLREDSKKWIIQSIEDNANE